MVRLEDRDAIVATNDFIEIGEVLSVGSDGLLKPLGEGELGIGVAMETVGPDWYLWIRREYDA